MGGRLEWNGNRREIDTLDELDRILDELEGQAEEPFMVELFRDDGASLSLGLGRGVTVLDYVRADFNPPYRQTYAPGTTQQSIWFRFRGDASEFPPEATVPYPKGRAALRHFFVTGELTPDLSWRET